MSGAPEPAILGRLVRSVDFERVLRQRSRAQGAHFALHHLMSLPSGPGPGREKARSRKLSTELEPTMVRSVDDSPESAPQELASTLSPAALSGLWLGAVVPKRHARRAVTRTLLKRQIYAAVTARAAALPAGLWVVRLRAGFERTAFPSAASTALRDAARTELDGLLERCIVPRAPA
jgi:ribonuclease P protein component